MKTILAPVDFSGATDAVMTEAAALAHAVEAQVVLMTVIQPPVITSEYAALMENMAEVVAAGEKTAGERLAKLQAKLEAEKLAVDTVQVNGAPIRAIIDHARKCDADYIVMGSHGHTALYDLLVGSTTHGVLMRATCPVVIVPATKPAPAKKKKT